jgi:hypothetical protein
MDYNYYYNKEQFDIPENYAHHRLKILSWHKDDGEYIHLGELLLTLCYQTSYRNDKTFTLFAPCSGYLNKMRQALDFQELRNNEWVYSIHEHDETRHKLKFINVPEVTIDDFTNKKIITWKQVGPINSYDRAISTKSIDGRTSLLFCFNSLQEKSR